MPFELCTSMSNHMSLHQVSQHSLCEPASFMGCKCKPTQTTSPLVHQPKVAHIFISQDAMFRLMHDLLTCRGESWGLTMMGTVLVVKVMACLLCLQEVAGCSCSCLYMHSVSVVHDLTYCNHIPPLAPHPLPLICLPGPFGLQSDVVKLRLGTAAKQAQAA